MSQARLVFRNTTVLAAARVIERLSGLVLALVVSRHLGASGLGVYATVIAYFGLISLAAESGSTNLIVRELSKDRSRTPSYLVHTSLMALGFSGVVMAIAWLVIPHLGYSADMRHGLELIVLAVAPGTLNTIQEGVFIAHQRVEFETLTTLVSSVALVATSLVFLKQGHGVVSLVAIFVIIEYAVTAVYFVIISRFIARLSFTLSRALAREIVLEARAFVGSSLVAGLFARPEIIILSLIATEAQVGYYGGVIKIVDLFQFIPQVYMINVFPVLSRSFHTRDGRAQEIQDQAMKYLLAVALPIAAGLFFASRQIVDTFYGDDFGNAVLLLRIMAFNVPLFCLHAVLWRVLAARGDQALMLRVQLVTTSARLMGGTALISLLRAVGAALAVPASLLLHVTLLARSVRRDGTRTPVLRLGGRFAVAATGMGFAVFAMRNTLPLWGLVPVAAVVYVVLVAAVRAFTADELATLRAVLPRRLAGSGGSS